MKVRVNASGYRPVLAIEHYGRCSVKSRMRRATPTVNVKGKYQALVSRRGHKRSIVAIGQKLLRVVYTVLKEQQPYRDPEIDYEALVVAKNAPRWLKALEKYGYLAETHPVAA